MPDAEIANNASKDKFVKPTSAFLIPDALMIKHAHQEKSVWLEIVSLDAGMTQLAHLGSSAWEILVLPDAEIMNSANKERSVKLMFVFLNLDAELDLIVVLPRDAIWKLDNASQTLVAL